MIILLGGSGYVGAAFRRYMERRDWAYISISRRDVDYYDEQELVTLLRETRASFLINAAGYTGKPNVDACEKDRARCLLANAVLPGILRMACARVRVPWGHVSSGCIYTGKREDGLPFRESDPPNFCFRSNNSSFYSGTKALGEECLADADNVFVWRLRMPFNEQNSARNYLSKILTYDRLLDVRNSLSHLDEYVRACCESWEFRIPFGTYHVTNTGSVTTREIAQMLQRRFGNKKFSFFKDEAEFMRHSAIAPRSSCVLDNSKLLSTGVKMSDVREAIAASIQQWTDAYPQSRSPVAI